MSTQQINSLNTIFELQHRIAEFEFTIKEKYFHIFFSGEYPINLIKLPIKISSLEENYLNMKIKELKETLDMYRVSDARLANDICSEFANSFKDKSAKEIQKLLLEYPIQFIKFLKICAVHNQTYDLAAVLRDAEKEKAKLINYSEDRIHTNYSQSSK